jgi:phenylacetate-CoA ligase
MTVVRPATSRYSGQPGVGVTREEILAQQWNLLSDQLHRLARTNPFYARRLQAAGADPARVTSLEAFRTLVPLCTKRDLLADQAAAPPFGTRVGVPDDEGVEVCFTSGTSGVGQEVYGHTELDVEHAAATLADGLSWCGLVPGDRIYSMAPLSTLSMGQLLVQAIRIGRYQPFHTFVLDSAAKLDLMRRFPPSAMVLTPAHLARLMSICQAEGFRPSEAIPDMKAIVLAGQSYPVELVQRAEEFWGAKVFDMYGSTQGKAVAATCELGAARDGRRMGLHLAEHHNLIEIVDPDSGEPVAPGEEGLVILTNLRTEGSPLLRFRTDDKVRYLGTDCACGRRSMMIEAGSISRYDDMMKVRGMNIWPQAVDDVMFSDDLVDEYVGVISMDSAQLEQIDIRYALAPGAALPEEGRAALAGRLSARLKAQTNVTCRLLEVARDELPVFEFKAVRWTDHRQSDLQKKIW